LKPTLVGTMLANTLELLLKIYSKKEQISLKLLSWVILNEP